MSELLAGSPGVITGHEWFVILLVAVVGAVVGGVAVWFIGRPR